MRIWRTDSPGGFMYHAEVRLPEGLLLVTDTFTYVHDGLYGTVATARTLREATLDGEPVFYPRSAELAGKAGLG